MSLLATWLSPRNVLLLLVSSSLLVFAAALVAQYGFGLRPCHLCLLQRYPYVGVAALGAVMLWLGDARLLRPALLVCATLLLIGGGIAAYHSLVEYGVVAGPSDCTIDGAVPDTIEAMRAQIMSAPLVPCDQPAGIIFGLSLAVWNSAVYGFLTILGFYGYRRSSRQESVV